MRRALVAKAMKKQRCAQLLAAVRHTGATKEVLEGAMIKAQKLELRDKS